MLEYICRSHFLYEIEHNTYPLETTVSSFIKRDIYSGYFIGFCDDDDGNKA